MKESLRLVTPVPGVVRRAVRDTELIGHLVPENTIVTASLHGAHHMHEYWPDPERFDPERFAGHRREDKVHKHAWTGPRCPGPKTACRSASDGSDRRHGRFLCGQDI